VSYEHKHNEANGQHNRDGSDANFSWNCGIEGPTSAAGVNELRAKQRRNLLATLLLSDGVPMILAGDEFGRTQQGNNNAYCQDNPTGWIDWSLKDSNEGEALLAFFRRIVRMRRSETPFGGMCWIGTGGREMTPRDWEVANVPHLGLVIRPKQPEGSSAITGALLAIMNAGHEPVEYTLPPASSEVRWTSVIDTANRLPSEDNIPAQSPVVVQPQSLRVLRAAAVGAGETLC
jgi:glycogen operon protein